MGDLACDSETVPMEGGGVSFVCEDSPVLLETLPPAGQTVCSCGKPHHSQDGTHEQCMNGDSVETEMDIPGSPSPGGKRGEGGDGNSQSHVVSEYSEPKDSSAYEPSSSFPPTLRLVSAMKGGRERSGEASPTEVRRVKWAPDVYDPPVTSVDHSVKSHQQRPRSRKKEKNKQKLKKKKRKSRGKNSGLHDAVSNPPVLQDPGPSSPDDFGDLVPEVVDSDAVGQDFVHGSSATHEMLDDATSSH
ncbi:uncharacterized protein LOC124661488 [Lolium rigidum]|uniref:uncharacterized protein LOC124661488 n=1 Tax=Lolium rigidum TaxID=89674 RepID=UPI001F5CA503|nr:uncharacterized protein LOC124661488 [Lolium rigidum]